MSVVKVLSNKTHFLILKDSKLLNYVSYKIKTTILVLNN